MRSTGKQVPHLQRFLKSFNQGYHLALVNKKTDKVASSYNWQLSLAALAYQSGDHSGITSLLPQSKAKGLLQNNKLKNNKRRGEKSSLASRTAREQAKLIIPTLAAFYRSILPTYKPFRRNEFCGWIVKALNTTGSYANLYASYHGYDELIDAAYAPRWWQEQLKKMQS
jgi:hypothetical protein|tara:strand:+ start:168 stop:674 length:507 start_codon:yes stop_codon:yes gene_type:complete